MEMNQLQALVFSLMKSPRFQIYIVLLVKCQVQENQSKRCHKALLVALKMKIEFIVHNNKKKITGNNPLYAYWMHTTFFVYLRKSNC